MKNFLSLCGMPEVGVFVIFSKYFVRSNWSKKCSDYDVLRVKNWQQGGGEKRASKPAPASKFI